MLLNYLQVDTCEFPEFLDHDFVVVFDLVDQQDFGTAEFDSGKSNGSSPCEYICNLARSSGK